MNTKIQHTNTRIPLGMPRSVEKQYPHTIRIPLGMRPNKTN